MKINPEVDEYLLKKGHPLTTEIQKVREIILETDDRIEETIKWSSPTFTYKGNMASFFMNARKFVSLMFHYGTYIEHVNDLLEGDGKMGRTARFKNMEDMRAKNPPFRNWLRNGSGYRTRIEVNYSDSELSPVPASTLIISISNSNVS